MDVRNWKPDSNIINSFIINKNIENLKFMYVYYNKGIYDIKLDVSQTAPENLRVFDVNTMGDSVQKYGTI